MVFWYVETGRAIVCQLEGWQFDSWLPHAKVTRQCVNVCDRYTEKIPSSIIKMFTSSKVNEWRTCY